MREPSFWERCVGAPQVLGKQVRSVKLAFCVLHTRLYGAQS